MTQIKFGTDGWRAIIGDDFVPANIEKVIQAFCDWRKQIDPSENKIILGYDRRNQSPESARIVSEVLLGNNFKVKLSEQFCPTPCVSWMTKNSDAFCGIMVTASHNPSQWNGIKFKEGYGGSASPEYTSRIEEQITKNEKDRLHAKKASFEHAKTEKNLELFSPHKDYVNHLRTLVDVKSISKSKFKILNDPLFGAGTGFIASVLGSEVDEIHSEADNTFGGINPEPIDKNLSAMMTKIKKGKYDVGLATDGDADRIGAVDEEGNYVNSHQIFALLLKHYVENKKLKGTIIKSVSATQMIPLLCAKYKLKCIETPIGFKHICEKLVKTNALMGGEESGGLSFAPHVHERDGILNGLFLLELMSLKKKRLGELIRDLYEEIGTFCFDRLDMHLAREKIDALDAKLKKSPPKSIEKRTVQEINKLDGVKFVLEDNSWLLIRASGTEPLLRIYAEASSPEQVAALLGYGKTLAESV